MAKSKIIKGLACGEISLLDAFYRLLLIATDINNCLLIDWANKEINGYNNFSDLPKYRIINAPNLRYSGINGGFQVTNVPLPSYFIDDELYEKVKKTGAFQGIAQLERMSKADKLLTRDLTYLSGEVQKRSGGIQCVSIEQIIDSTEFLNVLSAIKTRLIMTFQKLEQEYGNLDDLDIDINEKSEQEIKQINVVIEKLIYENNSVSIGDENNFTRAEIEAGKSGKKR